MRRRGWLKTLLAATFICASIALAAEGVAVKGNKKSKVYHKPACQHFAAKGSTEVFATEAAAKQAGYKACKQCGKAKAAKKANPAEKK